MSEPKSKLPDFKEITLIAGKLFNDVKKSINEIITDFKKRREEEDKVAKPRTASSKPKKTHSEVVVEKETVVVKAAKKPAPKKAKVKKDEVGK